MKGKLTASIAALSFLLVLASCGGGGSAQVPGILPGTKMTVTPTEAKSVSFEKYSDPTGYFTLEKPKGWTVKVGLKKTGEIDLISYAISVSDPTDVNREMYFNLNCVGGLKSQDAHDWYVTNYGANSHFAVMPVLPSLTTEGFFKASEESYGYRDFTVAENLGQSLFGGDILVGKCVSTVTGKAMEGVFTAMVDGSGSYMVQKNVFDFFGPQIDAWPVTVYTILMETAREEEIIEWQPVLDRIAGSISFTDKFIKERNEAWKQLQGSIANSYSMSDSKDFSSGVTDSWEKRNATYDVLSEKQSDATLGYERIYDTETGAYYRAESGFGEWYNGSRYQVVTSDQAYLSPIEGYINWK